jgi:hypothetical protein
VWLVPRRERAVDFARADRIDEHALAPHKVEDSDIGTSLLGAADHIEGSQVLNSSDDRGGSIDEGAYLELARQLPDGDPGDFATQAGEMI